MVTPIRSIATARKPKAAGDKAIPDPLEGLSERIHRSLRSDTGSRLAKARVGAWLHDLLETLFPHYSEEVYYTAEEIQGELELLGRDLRRVLAPFEQAMPRSAEDTAARFMEAVPGIYRKLRRDAVAIERGDPAAESVDEVIATYPGVLAIACHRMAHELHGLGVPVFPRMLTECAHDRTGIDIHPGAILGVPLVIDHGTGIVIGETAVLGDNVKLYQGVTLGALSVDKRLSSSKRHPTIEGDVVIYSNATVLGGSTVVGHDSVIGGNVWLTESVPPYSVVQHRSEVRVRRTRTEQAFTDFVI